MLDLTYIRLLESQVTTYIALDGGLKRKTTPFHCGDSQTIKTKDLQDSERGMSEHALCLPSDRISSLGSL